ncbi:ATP-binding protein [bacterium]|jgi:uncharacterized protein|nr:ATP-binding protein [bacterium]MBT3903319.1 ATP-binding protein [bacterium]MBT4577567.1 ATP-binding protein [bacterium]MBT5345727.1 ATP-binding protein [bacterium]MBT6130932.1 ATP-binding protein [bacterium]
MNKTQQQIGTLISGSLAEGFVMRLGSTVELEQIKTGKFVVVRGRSHTFFSIITDLKIEIARAEVAQFPPAQNSLLANVLQEYDMFASAFLRPMLMLSDSGQRMPVKTIPPHFSPVYEASHDDIATVFGDEKLDNTKYFSIGNPLDMDAPVCINLDKLTERSNGIFGKTGTGKTFITRLILAGLIKSEKAVNLVFDMHSEYGLQARQEGTEKAFVKGLKTLFPSKVAIFSLDAVSTRRRGSSPDVTIELTYDSISVEDVLGLQNELNLHATAVEAAYLIVAKHRKNWLKALLDCDGDLKDFAQSVGAHPESIAALYRKLKRIERLPFFTKNHTSNVVDQMIEYIDRGIHVIVEFGNYTSSFCYLLIANMITRKLHTAYIAKTEKFLGSQDKRDEPRKLLITIEEAHKFLNPTAAKQTIFGIIAREMRKYYVSLLVVDQRPSGIDAEVLSQIGTKFIAQLNDDNDIQAALTGVSGAQQLKTVLSTLDSKKQALVLGHAIAMPVVIKTREYDQKFYSAMAPITASTSTKKLVEELF